MTFPDGFYWGAATAAYQIEGAAAEGGRSSSVWDDFCRWPGRTYQGQSGDVACGHYQRYAQDVAAMRRMGLKAYRFSISWPRILPEGTGVINKAGMGFYDRLVDALLEAGIEPFVTLFHWDLPSTLHQRGGWLNRQSADWFAEYAAKVTVALSDRVKFWMTLNEPQVFLSQGYGDGTHAPGLKLSLAEQLLASHHVLLAHGKATQAIRAATRQSCQVGWAPAGLAMIPADDEDAKLIAAARQRTFAITKTDLWNSAWFMDPVYLGGYPQEGIDLYGSAVPPIEAGDMETIQQPMDFCGANLYNAAGVVGRQDGEITEVNRPVGHAMTAFRWPVEPEALYWGPKFFHERYRLPVYITENGLASTDWVSLDGSVHDPGRIDYMQRYLLSLRKTIADGVDVRGYFHWSLLDNFEWAEGYSQRFGLIHVDYDSLERTWKDSAHWYRRVIESNGDWLDHTASAPQPAQAQGTAALIATPPSAPHRLRNRTETPKR